MDNIQRDADGHLNASLTRFFGTYSLRRPHNSRVWSLTLTDTELPITLSMSSWSPASAVRSMEREVCLSLLNFLIRIAEAPIRDYDQHLTTLYNTDKAQELVETFSGGHEGRKAELQTWCIDVFDFLTSEHIIESNPRPDVVTVNL